VREITAAMRDDDFYVWKRIQDPLIHERGNHSGLLDRLTDAVPKKILLEALVLHAVGMDPHDNAKPIERGPQRPELRVTEVEPVDVRR
jgi:hypothetical protein